MNPCTWTLTQWSLVCLGWLVLACGVGVVWGAVVRAGRGDEPETVGAPTDWTTLHTATADDLKRQNASVLAELAEARRRLDVAQQRLDHAKWGS